MRLHLWSRMCLDTYGFPCICVLCDELVVKRGKDSDSLCVHHIDEDRSNNVIENLVPMHRACHERHHKQGRVFTQEHRDKIAAAARNRWADPDERERHRIRSSHAQLKRWAKVRAKEMT